MKHNCNPQPARLSLISRLILIFMMTFSLFTTQPVYAQVNALGATTWYVATTGNDSNSCNATDSPCLTINGAIGKAAASGDTIKVAQGTYTDTDFSVVIINKNINISGGWDLAFATQNGSSTVDGQNARRGVIVYSGIIASLDHFIVKNSGGAGAIGGGISNAGTLTVSNSSIHDNSAPSGQGGGISNSFSLTLNNTTISNNSADAGGGIFNSGSTLVLNNITVSNNSAGAGGGINNFNGIISVKNSIVADNSASGSGANCVGTITSNGYNILSSTSGCTITATSGDQFNVNPQLGIFLPTQGYQPLTVSSPAINAGNPATCLPTDQRGVSRVGTCDIGAYEYTAPGPAASISIDSGSGQRTGPNLAFPKPLKAVALDSQGSPVSGVSITFTAPGSGASGTFADSGTPITTVNTDSGGVATTSIFTANNQLGAYTVSASATGLGSINFNLENTAWFVAPSGNDANSCILPATSCATINGAIGKAASDDTIMVAAGTYTGSATSVVSIPISLTLSGGWNATFTTRNGISIIDGQNTRKGISLSNSGTHNVTLDYFVIQNGFGFSGGGVDVSSDFNLTINNSTLTNNVSSDMGGGGIVMNGGTVTLNNTTITGNQATSGVGYGGGGIFIYGGTMIINNSTIAGNNAAAKGGGIYGGFINGGTLTMHNSILANNTAGISGPDCFGTINNSEHNIISNTSGCTATPGAGDQFNVNPLISAYPVSGSAYFTLMSGSPAIDAGNPVTCLATDQRGMSRPQGSVCDIGAYEYVTVPGSAVSFGYAGGSNQRAAPGMAFSKPLVVYVLDGQGSAVSGQMVTFTAPDSGQSGTFADSGTNVTTAVSNSSGLAIPASFTANSQLGSYNVTATASGLAGTVTFSLTNAVWYVATTGNDANSCTSVAAPCLTIDGAIGKATAGDTINVAGGTYTGTTSSIVNINKDITLSGSWNPAFTSRSTPTIINGQNARGGVAIGNVTPSVAVTIEYFRVENGNSCSGGGIISRGSLTLRNSTISNNNGGDIGCAGGGGIWSYGALIINNTTLSGNISRDGGGIHVSGGSADLNNVTLANNLGTYRGGGILIESGTVTIRNTILAGNTATGDGPDCSGTLSSSGYNLIGNNSGCTFSATTGDLVGTSASPINPFLTPLQDNGGSTFTYGLYTGSPAIDAGNPASPGSGGSACLATDQRGTPRPVSTACDIGAFEGEVPAVQISGNAGVADATLSYMNGTPQTITADGSGLYSIPVPIDWSGTVTPSKPGLTFIPANRTYSDLATNQTSQNYTAVNLASIIRDPSFEAYTPNPYWSEYSTNFGTPLCASTCGDGGGTAGPRTGLVWGWFGGTSSNETASLSQTVNLPSGLSNLKLQFYFWIGAAEPGSDAADIFTAKIDGVTVFSANATQISAYPTYTLVSVDVSAYANGASHTITFSSVTTGQLVTFNLDDVALISLPSHTISGNAGLANANLSYTDGTPKTATADGSGIYSFIVPYGWSGTVTPWKSGFGFTPANRTYANVTADQTGQDYTASACSTTDVTIAGSLSGSYCLTSGQSTRQSYAANNGPVNVNSTGATPILAAQRILYYGTGTLPTSFVEMMGLPAGQLDTTYWFPWYKNVGDGIDTQLRIGNVSASTATVHIFVAGVEVTGSPFALTASGAGQSQRLSFALNDGPVKVVSDQNIVATERLIYFNSGVPASFSEMMGLPNSQLSNTYWFPWYKNIGEVDTQLRIGNVSGSTATVHIYIAGVEVTDSPFTLTTSGAGQSQRLSFPVNDGPVKIVSDVNIVAAQRLIYSESGLPTSFVETMGLPDSQLSTIHWFPWYKNDGIVDTQLRIGNVSGATASVHVYIGGVEMTGSPFTLTASGAGQSLRVSFPVNDGPVKIVSDQNIVTSERLIYFLSGVPVSFSEMMGLPDNQLSNTYWLPWYKNVGEIDTQLRFGMP